MLSAKNTDHGSGSRILGFLLQAIGALMMLASGLCTGAVIYGHISGTAGGSFQKDGPLILAIGGVPFLIGLGLFKLGERMRK